MEFLISILVTLGIFANPNVDKRQFQQLEKIDKKEVKQAADPSEVIIIHDDSELA